MCPKSRGEGDLETLGDLPHTEVPCLEGESYFWYLCCPPPIPRPHPVSGQLCTCHEADILHI